MAGSVYFCSTRHTTRPPPPRPAITGRGGGDSDSMTRSQNIQILLFLCRAIFSDMQGFKLWGCNCILVSNLDP
jgi:hypothetical protein